MVTLSMCALYGCCTARTGRQGPVHSRGEPVQAMIRGRVIYSGPGLEQSPIDVSPYPECRSLYPSGALSDQLLVQAKDGGVANALVYVEAPRQHVARAQVVPAVVLRHKHCLYEPRVLGVTVGQPIVIENEDPFPHTNHPLSRFQAERGEIGLPTGRERLIFDAEEIFVELRCDLHPWEIAHIAVLNHDLFAVTDRTGLFSILATLPQGEYRIRAVHELFGTREKVLTLAEDTRQVEVTMEFSTIRPK